jgi:hypothetical protein
MPFLVDDPEHWRAKAAECRVQAAAMQHPRYRETLIAVAEAYERLAASAEEAMKVGIKPRGWIA